METFKRVLAVIVLILAVIGVLVMLAGVVGSWVVRNKVTAVTLNLLTVGETAVTATSGSLNRIDDRLDVSQARIDTLEMNVAEAGEGLKETSVVMTVISNTIGTELAPALGQAKETAVTIKDTTFALDEAITTANELPFINLDGFVPTLIGDIADGIIAAEERVTELQQEVRDRRENRVGEGVDFVTGYTTDLSNRIGNLQNKVNEADDRLGETSASLAVLKISLPRTFTLITLAVNFVLLFMALAFASLIIHAWTFIKNPAQDLFDIVRAGDV